MSSAEKAPVSGQTPQLRFRGFDGDWIECKLAEAATINPKNTSLPETFHYIDLESVSNGILTEPLLIAADSAPSRAQRVLTDNDILFQMVRPYQKNNFFFSLGGTYVASTGYAQIRYPSAPKFLFQLLHTDHFVSQVLVRSTGTNYPAINSNDLGKISVSLPETLAEQQKIALFLSAVDEKIAHFARKKKSLERYKKGCMQKLFSGSIRFTRDDGTSFPDWKSKRLDAVLELCQREVAKPTEPYLALGIRSHMKGTFQKPDFDPDSIAMEKLYEVHKNDLIVNITFAWEGAIAVARPEDHGGLVSHRFPTYRGKENELSIDYAKQIIRLPKFKHSLDLISPGGAGRNRVLSKKEFLKLEWEFPTHAEQEKIAELLDAIDHKIDLAGEVLQLTQTFKKGLLQRMFV